MAYTNIDLPTDYFNTKLYTGNGSTQSITGVGFQPDFVWIKDRSDAYDHRLCDSVRGATKLLYSSLTNAEATEATSLTSFNSDGFSLGSANGVNSNADNHVAWNWKANGAGVSNTAGTITSTVSANTTSGFSIVSWTGNGTTGATVGHGLSVKPAMVIMKDRDTSGNSWATWHKGLTGESYCMFLDATDAQADYSTIFTAFNTNTFTMGSGSNNTNGSQQIAYCFAEKKGFSKFGSYTGNGSTDGTFIYTGFKPAFVMRKRTDTTADWRMDDSKRDGYNVIPHTLFPNYNNAETTSSGYYVDLLSNGFKCRGTSVNQNASSGTYIYMAFAESPFVSSKGIPTTAR